MKLIYIGAGFVGTCSAAVAADSGHDVLVYDIDQTKIDKLGSGDYNQIQSCLFEEGLADLLIRNKERIKFTFDYNLVESFLNDGDAVFMCLPTPEIAETGESNLSYYFTAAEKLAESLVKRNQGKQEKYIVIINKSTVPVDMVNKTEELLNKAGVNNFGVVSNPEFLVEGKAISGSLKPDRIVVGANSQKDFEVMRVVYQRFFSSPTVEYLEVSPEEAAAGKLLANFVLFNKLAVCFDVVGRTCETFDNVKFENVRKILTSDKRIGSWGLYDSLYAGGSCLIKDSRSLLHQLKSAGQKVDLVDEIYSANHRQLQTFLDRAEKEANFNWGDKVVTLLGTAFKRDTNDIRNSASIKIVKFLLEKKVKQINIFDPAALGWFKELFPESEVIKYYDNETVAIDKSDAIIIATDWPQFRELDKVLVVLGKKPLIMDGRRILSHQYKELGEIGYDIIAVGSPFLEGKKVGK
ncbi:MAG: UDP-glucose/GDP-mannose dehydrogenase [Candidatus Magasanikbacteria bacterium GW2011_GWA2_37_8]|uniref:UDP-glucose 6-dehydrogenase n=1 Tax=Candidatus Magasanikbacteria bacterium GW2011_GWA2_37_8 TaxID=1619036 RepID=A0A0G0KJA2_9BACT|nr:MAG: UDP-glucose/GDP-mannose dehydrogenase [Candidatus Magasanikbacteria bacterium GW2011_GWA2_37_8]